MRKQVLFIVLTLLFTAQVIVAQTAHAVYCETDGRATLYFLCSDITPAGTHNGQPIIEVWSGEDITNMPDYDYTLRQGPKWLFDGKSEKLRHVVFEESFKDARPTNCSMWFYYCDRLETIEGIEYLNTSNVENMYKMFLYCKSLGSLDVSRFETSKVRNMAGMFDGCRLLTSIDVSKFETSNVTDMNSMFYGCDCLVSLDVSKFNTSKVTDMSGMFAYCNSLVSLDVTNFDVSNVTDMSSMFNGCRSLSSLDVSSFDVSKVTDMRAMFYGCDDLTSLDVSGFNTSNVTNMGTMFCGCSALTSLDLSDFNTSNVTDMSGMFSGCNSLASLDLTNFNTSRVSFMNNMFQYCEKLTSLDVSSFNTQNVTDMSGMFFNCRSLTSLDVSNFNTENVTDMSFAFSGCNSLTSLDLSNFNTANVTNMCVMFNDCRSLTSLDLRNFNTSKVTEMASMFSGCHDLISLDISNFDISNVNEENMKSVLLNCRSLEKLDLRNITGGIAKLANHDNISKMGAMIIVPESTDLENEVSEENYIVKPESGTSFVRTYATDALYTLYLPFAVDAVSHGSFYKYNGIEDMYVTFKKIDGDTTTAGSAYMFKPKSKGKVVFTTDMVLAELPENIQEDEAPGLYGVYTQKKFTSDNINSDVYYEWLERMEGPGWYAGGEFNRAYGNTTIEHNRAYLKLDSPVKNSDRLLVILDNTTDINTVRMMSADTPIYNMQGQRVDESNKGIVIKNGKKVILR